MYYVAVICPPELDERITKFKIWMRTYFGCKIALKSPGHITLIPPFWMEEAQEPALHETFFTFQSSQQPISIDLNNFSHFSDRVLFINVDDNPALHTLRKDVEDHFLQTLDGAITPDERPYHPHVTIANRDVTPAMFVKAWDYFSKQTFQASFETDQFSLLKLIDGKWQVVEEHSWVVK
jgi:2'-5' RNA ligase